ncbi:hypothetical protein KXV85_004326, partial [Aspergillus fumigatus]
RQHKMRSAAPSSAARPVRFSVARSGAAAALQSARCWVLAPARPWPRRAIRARAAITITTTAATCRGPTAPTCWSIPAIAPLRRRPRRAMCAKAMRRVRPARARRPSIRATARRVSEARPAGSEKQHRRVTPSANVPHDDTRAAAPHHADSSSFRWIGWGRP